MKLLSVHISSPEVLGELDVPFQTDGHAPRNITLIVGGPGSGKTTLLAAIGNTRPGHTVAMGIRPSEAECSASCSWWLGMDEPDRSKPLVLHSPNAPEAQQATDARREAAFFERLARQGGFVFLALSAMRWFSKAPLLLSTPERTVARYDVRTSEPMDDAGRNDLGREVKQVLAYSSIVRFLPHAHGERERLLGEAMARLVGDLCEPYGFSFDGVEPRSLEPVFTHNSGRRLRFDALPAATKHAISFGALPLRALWAAYPGMDPKRAQGVVAIDQFELHQNETTAEELIEILTRSLPDVQWILTTRSDQLAAARPSEETFALRRIGERGAVQVFTGKASRLH